MSDFHCADARPAWMEDELVRDIPEKKLAFLGKVFTESKGGGGAKNRGLDDSPGRTSGKSPKEMMAYLMPLMAQARKENLTFSPQEMNAVIAAIKKYSSREELSRIDKILAQADTKERH